MLQHIAILGKTGSGKTYAAKSLVERRLAASAQVVVIDPTGAWWGLRLRPDGSPGGVGKDVLVLGGAHGDLPLTSDSGPAVADLIVSQRLSVICDVSALSVGERTQWFIGFGDRLRTLTHKPITLAIDEVHLFAPQGKVPDPQTSKMLHVANTLFSGGRSRGIRLIAITQRPAKFHKDSLTCVDTLVAMRMLAPQDREAVKEWIDGCGDAAKGKEILGTLATLQKGEGWVWYPEGNVLERGRFPKIATYDSSATPTDDQEAGPAPTLGDIDLSAIRAGLESAIAEAKANDPKALKKRVEELEQQLHDASERVPTQATPSEVAILKLNLDHMTTRWQRSVKAFDEAVHAMRAIRQSAEPLLDRRCEDCRAVSTFQDGDGIYLCDECISAQEEQPNDDDLQPNVDGSVRRLPSDVPSPSPRPREDHRPGVEAGQAGGARARSEPGLDRHVRGHLPGVRAPGSGGSGASDDFPPRRRRILGAILWWASIGVKFPTREQVAWMAGTSASTSTYERDLGALRTSELVAYPVPGCIAATSKTAQHAEHIAAPRTIDALRSQAMERLDEPRRKRILAAIIDSHKAGTPSMTRAALARAAGTSETTSTFERDLGSMRTNCLIDYPEAGRVALSNILKKLGA